MKFRDIQQMTPHCPKNVFSSSSRRRPKNALETSRINLQGTSLGRRIRTSPGRHFETSVGRQIGTFPGRQFGMLRGCSNRIFRGRWSGTFSGRSGDQYLPVGRILHCYHNLSYIYCQLLHIDEQHDIFHLSYHYSVINKISIHFYFCH